jgi:progranulin
MWSPQSLSSISFPLLSLSVNSVLAQHNLPTAIRRQAPDAGAKILPEHLAFAPINILLPQDTLSLDEHHDDEHTKRQYHPAFRPVRDGGASDNMFRRAAEALSILEKRQACFAGMNSCAEIGKPEKCCQEGTYCQEVPDPSLGEVACCPFGGSCDGTAKCPSDAVTCPESLGGGCCLSGYECQGSICKC